MRSSAYAAVACAVVALAPLGCALPWTDQAPVGSAHEMQIIVRFRAAFDPTQPDALARLGRETGTELQYLRPMAAGAHVLRARTDGALADALERLRRHRDIEQVEIDRTVRGAGSP